MVCGGQCTFDGEDAVLEARGRHDPCVLPRVPPIVEVLDASFVGKLIFVVRP